VRAAVATADLATLPGENAREVGGEGRATFEVATKGARPLVISRPLTALRGSYKERVKPLVDALTAIERRLDAGSASVTTRAVEVRELDANGRELGRLELQPGGELVVTSRAKDGAAVVHRGRATEAELERFRAGLDGSRFMLRGEGVAPLLVTVTAASEGVTRETSYPSRTPVLIAACEAMIRRVSSAGPRTSGLLGGIR
jgi:hypothetical protein